ncbi:hypothetical protein BO79DRAFT_227675 [Aspergillus costaricaensis CBS 115574]|uniref:Uncharacterized protein n=1 Tax=Aspergillus costaricaensis CBS 115574 TaxID=1448317 RepID=A0ACD1IFX2_9EURO|nr:hypothetical protein BO79DRAFT_227675 [Aspergillus costaricaensis CBS 115574]RAK89467.1 hypothetical protein BO79DRAFT_227675 [Aspergillus costaricaensis CBS 115574]
MIGEKAADEWVARMAYLKPPGWERVETGSSRNEEGRKIVRWGMCKLEVDDDSLSWIPSHTVRNTTSHAVDAQVGWTGHVFETENGVMAMIGCDARQLQLDLAVK